MEFHEYANLFPMMGEAELDQLAESIRQHGQQFPVVIYEGKILDGRNRYRACVKLGREPETVDYAGADPLAFAVACNLDRRHLSDSQRALIGAELARLRHGTKRYNLETSIEVSRSERKTIDAAAAEMKVSSASIDRAKKIKRNGVPELVAAVYDGQVTVFAGALVAKLPADEQRELIEKGPDAVTAKATEIRTTPKAGAPAEPEGPPLVVDGTAPRKVLPCVPNEAEDLWLLARSYLDKIHRLDAGREEVLKLVVKYATERLEMKK